MNQTLVSKINRINSLLERASRVEDLELSAHLSRYICVLVYGLLEVGIVSILSQITQEQSSPRIANYVQSCLNRERSPKSENIKQMIGHFDSSWEKKISEICTGKIFDSVNSVVANRHTIAHGDDVGITLKRVEGYYEDIKDFLRVFEKTINA